MLVCGTTQGVYTLAVGATKVRLALLPGQLITHVAALHQTIAAAVPVLGPVHSMLGQSFPPDQAQRQASGVHLLKLDDGASTSQHVWQGDARAVGLAPGLLGQPPHVYVGKFYRHSDLSQGLRPSCP